MVIILLRDDYALRCYYALRHEVRYVENMSASGITSLINCEGWRVPRAAPQCAEFTHGTAWMNSILLLERSCIVNDMDIVPYWLAFD